MAKPSRPRRVSHFRFLPTWHNQHRGIRQASGALSRRLRLPGSMESIVCFKVITGLCSASSQRVRLVRGFPEGTHHCRNSGKVFSACPPSLPPGGLQPASANAVPVCSGSEKTCSLWCAEFMGAANDDISQLRRISLAGSCLPNH